MNDNESNEFIQGIPQGGRTPEERKTSFKIRRNGVVQMIDEDRLKNVLTDEDRAHIIEVLDALQKNYDDWIKCEPSANPIVSSIKINTLSEFLYQEILNKYDYITIIKEIPLCGDSEARRLMMERFIDVLV
jgi:hypothetical protein